MSLINSYALWNNKGGVGKSTISFHLSMRYAETHPDAKVLVIDLCPQANSSMMLLGGGALGDERVVELCSRDSKVCCWICKYCNYKWTWCKFAKSV